MNEIKFTEAELEAFIKSMGGSRGMMQQALLNQVLFELIKQQGGHVAVSYSKMCGPELVAGVKVEFTNTGIEITTVDTEVIFSLLESEGQEKH